MASEKQVRKEKSAVGGGSYFRKIQVKWIWQILLIHIYIVDS